MHDIPLNDTQRITFLRQEPQPCLQVSARENLPASEYYDIVIFGYLRAVQRYLTDPNLEISFAATVAWRAMVKLSIPTAPTSAVSASSVLFVPVSLTPGI